MRKKRSCNHILVNGEVCDAVPLRDSDFCYWHHKARARQRRLQRVCLPLAREAETAIELPLLEDGNAIQVAIQEIMQAILDGRIDSRRAGLLLYSIQLAASNLRNLAPRDPEQITIATIGSEDQSVFNDRIGSDHSEEPRCCYDCRKCFKPHCSQRTRPIPKIPPASALAPARPKALP